MKFKLSDCKLVEQGVKHVHLKKANQDLNPYYLHGTALKKVLHHTHPPVAQAGRCKEIERKSKRAIHVPGCLLGCCRMEEGVG